MTELFANSGNPDQTPHSVASDLGLHCLPITLLGVCRLQWVSRLHQGRMIMRACPKPPQIVQKSWVVFIYLMNSIFDTVSLLYTEIGYNVKFHYNDNLTSTTPLKRWHLIRNYARTLYVTLQETCSDIYRMNREKGKWTKQHMGHSFVIWKISWLSDRCFCYWTIGWEKWTKREQIEWGRPYRFVKYYFRC